MSGAELVAKIKEIVSDPEMWSNRTKRESIEAIQALLGVDPDEAMAVQPAPEAAPVVVEEVPDEPDAVDEAGSDDAPEVVEDAEPVVKRKPGRPPRVAVEPADAGEE